MWLEQFRGLWNQRLDALATELARGKRERRIKQAAASETNPTPNASREEPRES